MNQGTSPQSDVLLGKQASRYAKTSWSVNFLHKKALSLIALHDGQTLLDIGCGPGGMLLELFRNYSNQVFLFGVDPSPDMIRIAQEKAAAAQAGISFQVAGGEDLPFEKEKFDWVTSSLAIHHLPLPLKERALAEAFRVLKPGGQILISDFGEAEGWLSKIGAFLYKFHSHARDNFRGEIKKLLTKAGFDEIRVVARQRILFEHILARKKSRLSTQREL